MVRLEERLLAKEAALEGQRTTLDRREQEFEAQRAEIESCASATCSSSSGSRA